MCQMGAVTWVLARCRLGVLLRRGNFTIILPAKPHFFLAQPPLTAYPRMPLPHLLACYLSSTNI